MKREKGRDEKEKVAEIESIPCHALVLRANAVTTAAALIHTLDGIMCALLLEIIDASG